jgi:hypothetical protein
MRLPGHAVGVTRLTGAIFPRLDAGCEGQSREFLDRECQEEIDAVCERQVGALKFGATSDVITERARRVRHLPVREACPRHDMPLSHTVTIASGLTCAD